MKDGKYKCYKCNGTGKKLSFGPNKYYYECIIKCPICKGNGVLDWISNIVGNPNNTKLDVDIMVKPIKPIERIEFDFVIDKDGIVK